MLSDLVNPAYSCIKHEVLVKRATKWVSRKYFLAIPEFRSTKQVESPDVIGFSDYDSIVIECKASYSDFVADFRKDFRVNGFDGMGDKRYYFSPPGVIPQSELPAGWGLLEWRGGLGHVIILKESELFKGNKRREFMLMTTVLSRLRCFADDKIIIDGPSIIEPEELLKPTIPKFASRR